MIGLMKLLLGFLENSIPGPGSLGCITILGILDLSSGNNRCSYTFIILKILDLNNIRILNLSIKKHYL